MLPVQYAVCVCMCACVCVCVRACLRACIHMFVGETEGARGTLLWSDRVPSDVLKCAMNHSCYGRSEVTLYWVK